VQGRHLPHPSCRCDCDARRGCRYEKNFVHAFAAHIKFLKDMGNAGHAVHMD